MDMTLTSRYHDLGILELDLRTLAYSAEVFRDFHII